MPKTETETVCNLLRSFDTAMLITSAQTSSPRARPMAIACVEDNGDLWFFTGRSTHKVGEVENNHEVLVVCQKDYARYLCVSGTAELIRDRAQARSLWKESYKVWFPAGVEDPDLILIRVRVAEAEYWDNRGAKGVRYAFEAAKAYVTGTRPEIKEGDQHGRVALK